MSLLYDIDDAKQYKTLTNELQSFILNNTRSSEIHQLMTAAQKNDAVDIYRFIVENYNIKKNDMMFDFGSFKHQHQANLDKLHYLTPFPYKIKEYIESGLEEYERLSQNSDKAQSIIESNICMNDKFVKWAIKSHKRNYDYDKLDEFVVYKILKYSS